MTVKKKNTSVIGKLLASTGTAALIALVWGVLFTALDWGALPIYTGQGREGQIPNLLGRDVDGAELLAKNTGFGIHSEIVQRPDARYPVGSVIEQYPAAGCICKLGRKIKVTVSSGEELVAVPPVVGDAEKEAVMKLKATGLEVREGDTRYIYSTYYPEGVAAEQSVPAGVKIARGSVVILTVSVGEAPVKSIIPEVRRKTFSEARRAIFKAGMKLGTVEYVEYLRAEEGVVLWQFPAGGDKAEPGAEVNIRVNQVKTSAPEAVADSTETPAEAPANDE